MDNSSSSSIFADGCGGAGAGGAGAGFKICYDENEVQKG